MDNRTKYLWEAYSQIASCTALAEEVFSRLAPLLPDEQSQADAHMALDALRRASAKAQTMQEVLAAQTEATKAGGVQ